MAPNPPPGPIEADSSRPPDGRPADGSASDAATVRRMFSAIAPRYDLLNRLLSLNIDRRWRRSTVDRVMEGSSPEVPWLDACAGTYELALEIASRPGWTGPVYAADFALPMLEHGAGKLAGTQVVPVCADALRLPFPNGAFAGVTVGFGVRNLADLDLGFAEFARVIAPGGRLIILEFTLPPNRILRPLYLFYFTRVLPRIGGLISGHPWAYEYLPDSVRNFPEPEELADRMVAAGFSRASYSLLSGGIAAIHVAVR